MFCNSFWLFAFIFGFWMLHYWVFVAVACNSPTGLGDNATEFGDSATWIGILNIDDVNNNITKVDNIDIDDTFYKKRMSRISPKKGSLSTVIRSYKSAVSKYANTNNIMFGWQTLFYDHIIRNEESYNKIQQYITQNPQKWLEDKLFFE